MDPGEEIKRCAIEVGADIVGITDASPFANWLDDKAEAIGAGLLPERCVEKMVGDPSDVLPGARSIVVFGIGYPGFASPDPASAPRIGSGLGLRPRSRETATALERKLQELGGRTASNTDIPCKRAAVRAGLGWLGRNSLFTTAGLGPAVRISTVITDLELEPDGPATGEGCGECTSCIESCPAGALAVERRYDVGRCLCYLTEYDVPLPVELRPLLSNRFIDCEECQIACPHGGSLPLVEWQGPDILELALQAADDFPSLSAWIATRYEFTLEPRAGLEDPCGEPRERPRVRGGAPPRAPCPRETRDARSVRAVGPGETVRSNISVSFQYTEPCTRLVSIRLAGASL